jgi:CheY-like chemotaxis protein
MNRTGPVIVIEDDADDRYFFKAAFQKLNSENELVFFDDGQLAYEYLKRPEVKPFIIICDINMPKLDGFALRDKIMLDAALQTKCVPYLFFSTASAPNFIVQAYKLSVQGFFVKQNSIKELEKTLRVIMEYWQRCVAPNDSL